MIRQLILILLLGFVASAATALEITARSWAVADQKGNILQEFNSQQINSIASITKLMTAMVVLDSQQDLNQRLGSHTRRQLLQLSLIHSSNQAAETLCQSYPKGRSACLHAMNSKAQALNMHNTKFVDPTGLGIMNISSSQDLIIMTLAASNYSEIVLSSQLFKTKIGRTIVYNTNHLVDKNYLVSKTGFIKASGGCIVMMLDTSVGRRIVVVLGSQNTRTRILEAEFISRLI